MRLPLPAPTPHPPTDPDERWHHEGRLETVAATGSRHDGVTAVKAPPVDRFSVDAEASYGQLGPAAKLGTSYQATDRTTLYLNYALENESVNSFKKLKQP